MNGIFLIGIRLYQRYVSPYKGFRCSHAAFFGGKSCSGAIYALILKKGIVAAWPLIRQQFDECSWAHRMLGHVREEQRRRQQQEGALCDAFCRVFDVCDVFDGDCNPCK